MIYCFYGEDDYSIKTQIKKLAQDFTGIEYVLEKEDVSPNLQSIQQVSLFGTRSLLVFRDLLSHLEPAQLENIPQDVVVIFWEGTTLDKRKAIVKWVHKRAHVQEFRPLARQAVYEWVREQGYEVDYKVQQLLWNRHGANLWAWNNELQKLALFSGENKKIDKKATDVLSGPTVEENIFSFLDAFGERQNLLSLVLVERLLRGNVDPFFLHSMLARQVRLLLLSQETGALQGQPPFIRQKLQQQTKKWSELELRMVHRRLLEADLAVKRGQAELENELLQLLLY